MQKEPAHIWHFGESKILQVFIVTFSRTTDLSFSSIRFISFYTEITRWWNTKYAKQKSKPHRNFNAKLGVSQIMTIHKTPDTDLSQENESKCVVTAWISSCVYFSDNLTPVITNLRETSPQIHMTTDEMSHACVDGRMLVSKLSKNKT
jgi:hypothetical protein